MTKIILLIDFGKLFKIDLTRLTCINLFKIDVIRLTFMNLFKIDLTQRLL